MAQIDEYWPTILNARSGAVSYIRFKASSVVPTPAGAGATNPRPGFLPMTLAGSKASMFTADTYATLQETDGGGVYWYTLKLTGKMAPTPGGPTGPPPVGPQDITITITGDGGNPVPITTIVFNGSIALTTLDMLDGPALTLTQVLSPGLLLDFAGFDNFVGLTVSGGTSETVINPALGGLDAQFFEITDVSYAGPGSVDGTYQYQVTLTGTGGGPGPIFEKKKTRRAVLFDIDLTITIDNVSYTPIAAILWPYNVIEEIVVIESDQA